MIKHIVAAAQPRESAAAREAFQRGELHANARRTVAAAVELDSWINGFGSLPELARCHYLTQGGGPRMNIRLQDGTRFWTLYDRGAIQRIRVRLPGHPTRDFGPRHQDALRWIREYQAAAAFGLACRGLLQ